MRVIITAILLLSVSSFAAQPPRFNYQAKLTDSNGNPLQGAHTLTLRIFQGGDANTANSGTEVYEETAALNLTDGVANHTVGAGASPSPGPFNASMLRTSSDVFLEVEVDSPGNIVLPRTRLESVPFAILSADGEVRIPLSQPNSFPIAISSPGSYYLTENLTNSGSGDGIQIFASNVRLDLNGYTMTGSASADAAIKLLGTARTAEICNGVLIGWEHGITGSTAAGVHVHHVAAIENRRAGMVLGAQALVEESRAERNGGAIDAGGISVSTSSLVRRCIASDNVATGANGSAHGILVGNNSLVSECVCVGNIGRGTGSGYGINTGNACQVINNLCAANAVTGTGTGSASGITLGGGGEASGNLCTGNIASQASGSVAGIRAFSESYIHHNQCGDNIVTGNGAAVGISATGRCRIENNHCYSQTGSTGNLNYGIRITGGTSSGSVIVRNTTTNNTDAGIRLENTSGVNYHGVNILDEVTAVSLAGGTNVTTAGDRANITF